MQQCETLFKTPTPVDTLIIAQSAGKVNPFLKFRHYAEFQQLVLCKVLFSVSGNRGGSVKSPPLPHCYRLTLAAAIVGATPPHPLCIKEW